MKMRCRITEKGELVTRDGVLVGKIDAISLDLYVDLGGKGGRGEEAKEELQTPPPPSEADGRLFESPSPRQALAEHWKLRSGRELKLSDSKVRTVLDHALKARDLETCKRAIDGLFADPWWKENVKTLELRHALRGNSARGESDADRIDKMAEKAPGNVSSLEAFLRSLDDSTRNTVLMRMRNAASDIRDGRDAAAALATLAAHGIQPIMADDQLTGWAYGQEAVASGA